MLGAGYRDLTLYELRHTAGGAGERRGEVCRHWPSHGREGMTGAGYARSHDPGHETHEARLVKIRPYAPQSSCTEFLSLDLGYCSCLLSSNDTLSLHSFLPSLPSRFRQCCAKWRIMFLGEYPKVGTGVDHVLHHDIIGVL